MKANDNEISNYIESRLTRVETVIESINQNLKDIKSEIKDIKIDVKDVKKELKETEIRLTSKINAQFYLIVASILIPTCSVSITYILKSFHLIA